MVYSKVEMPHHFLNSGTDDSSQHSVHKRVSSIWKLADDVSIHVHLHVLGNLQTYSGEKRMGPGEGKREREHSIFLHYVVHEFFYALYSLPRLLLCVLSAIDEVLHK